MKNRISAITLAISAAVLYGISAPVSKLLLQQIPPAMMASLLYLGAGIGMLLINVFRRFGKSQHTEASLTKKELPYIISMIILDIAAPVFLMIALTKTTAGNASLLNNFEIVATSLIALFVFKEAIGKRMWLAIALITIASVILTINDSESFTFSIGSVFVLLACVCWGFENNSTRMLSIKDPLQVVVVKGFGSGIGALIISFSIGQAAVDLKYLLAALLLGFIAYGLSIYFYIMAQRTLGAARTSAYYATAPFIGVLISWIFLRESVHWSFLVALFIMILGSYFAITETHGHIHEHEPLSHEHNHNHQDGHHNHTHRNNAAEDHSHEHTHESIDHEHAHLPDSHHQHKH